ncbi:hypothetical protein D3C85_540910 [compost metagenome]
MDVHFGVAGQLDVDHRFEPGDIQASRGDVGGHQHAAALVGEEGQHLVTLALIEVAVQRLGGDAVVAQVGFQLLALLAGVAEGDAGLRAHLLQEAQHGVHALARVDLVEALLDLAVVVQGVHLHLLRVAHEGLRQLGDARRVGGGEQQGLPACRELLDDLGDAVVEAHVEHAVGFVQHQGVEAVEHQGALAQVLLDAARRTDDDMGAMLQGAHLRAVGHATAEGEHLDVAVAAGEAADFLGHLVGQLAGGAEHQCLAAEEARIQRLQQADAEGGGLAAAGLGLGDQVLALEDQRQALRLDRRHVAVAQALQVGQGGCGEGQGGEGGGGHGTGLESRNGAQFSRMAHGAPFTRRDRGAPGARRGRCWTCRQRAFALAPGC